MSTVRMTAAWLILAISSIYLLAQQPKQKITVTGKLVRAMAIGAESTGWMLELDSPIMIGDKQVNSIQIDYGDTGKLEELQNKLLTVKGKLSHRQGVETGEQPVLNVSSMKEVKVPGEGNHEPKGGFDLSGSQWRLEDIGGAGVIDNSQATLAFPEAGKIAGNDSCNRFFGSAEIKGDTIKLSPLGATRMACPEAVMNQETKYLRTLQSAERFELKYPYLLIYSKGLEQPLLFTKVEGKHETP
jgi:heat shock protein HslJ